MKESINLGLVIGQNVRRLRQEKHITQERLAEKSEVSVNTIRNIEKGRWPSAYTLQAVASALKVDAKFLLSCESDEMYLKEELQSKLEQAFEFLVKKPPETGGKTAYSVGHLTGSKKL